MTVVLLALLAALPQQDPPARGNTEATIHGLVIPVPAGWTRQDDASGAVQLVPPPDPGSSFRWLLLVLPPNKIQGTHWELHKAMLQSLLQQAQWTGNEPAIVHKPEGPGVFIKTEAAGRSAAGEPRELTLFTAAHDGVMEAVVGVHRIDRAVVDPMLKAARFKNPPAAPVRPRIVEAYRRVNQRLYDTRDGGARDAGSLLYDRIWLRSDGVADFSTVYLEGYAAAPVALKVDAGLLSGDYGSWKTVGDKVHVTRAATEVFERVNGGLRGGGKEWEPMPRVDGLKLSGRWEIKSPPEEKVSPYHDWIEFTPEGRFKTDGVPRRVASGDGLAKPPQRGAGTYEILDWTIFLTFDDGTKWSTDFSPLGRELKPDMSILFRTYVFPKGK